MHVSPPIVLAHQGGWDEMLMVSAPILLFWLILRLARRRAERFGLELDGEAPSGHAEPTDPHSGSTASESHALDPEHR